ncbi:hypothetical protein RF11_15872 [Thelohanellus kitauei]|uniref:Uncharacterized protein n=1 Tax=Thelohanellus kitauei TaxID=669202 RepID=A0A0C2MSM5_THEKT|nr:hypothetical protein RF11_15872 [Thelohanellus kitauei]
MESPRRVHETLDSSQKKLFSKSAPYASKNFFQRKILSFILYGNNATPTFRSLLSRFSGASVEYQEGKTSGFSPPSDGRSMSASISKYIASHRFTGASSGVLLWIMGQTDHPLVSTGTSSTEPQQEMAGDYSSSF